MLNFSRGSGDRPPDANDPRNSGKPALRPATYDPPGSPGSASSAARALPPDPAPLREGRAGVARSESAHASPPSPALAPAPANAAAAPTAESTGSKLFVGVNIKLKGVEISDCDLLVVEGNVEATVHSKEMHIAQPGTLHGTALIDVAEVHGEFTGELTARTRLVVHGTGKVSGTIRYGRLIVADGGTISGDMKQIDAVEPRATPSRTTAHDSRHSTSTARATGSN
jgi:cytoskeletal protein CcmA (bactofilin family)